MADAKSGRRDSNETGEFPDTTRAAALALSSKMARQRKRSGPGPQRSKRQKVAKTEPQVKQESGNRVQVSKPSHAHVLFLNCTLL